LPTKTRGQVSGWGHPFEKQPEPPPKSIQGVQFLKKSIFSTENH